MRIWVTWENQRRNRELAQAVGARLFEFKEIDQIRNPFLKYTLGLWKTAAVLLRDRPSEVFCQNPSLILSVFLVTLAKALRFRVVMDAHNAGLNPLEGRSALLNALSRYAQRNAAVTLVTNPGLFDHVQNQGGRPFILPDRIPTFPPAPTKQLKGDFNFLFICSFASDEPYEIVFEAARRLPPRIHFYVSGNHSKKDIARDTLPENLSLLGYVSEEEYVRMLHSVDATIDLTTREDCLVCGAYETLALSKPQILSNTRALRSFFEKGAVFTNNDAGSLVDAVHQIMENRDRLVQEAIELRHRRQSEWEGKRRALDHLLGNLPDRRKSA
jgi:glycosyltransferase involved in cell wall biosynthesis